jgi:C_GCAxxG_C_C family probable redox protein
MDRIDLASQCFREGFNCSQAVFSAYAPDLGLDRETALKAAAAFGGGIARTGGTCGAVTGALMTIGLACGRTRAEDKEAMKRTNRLADEFMERFRSRNYSVECRQLLGCEIGTPEGFKFAETENLREKLCAVFVKDAAEIVEELLYGQKETGDIEGNF